MSLPRRMGVGVLALASLLLALGLFPQDALRRAAERRLRSALGPQSRLESLHVVPVLLRADVGGLHISGPGYSLLVPKGRVALAPAALLERAPKLRLLEVNALRLELWPAPRLPTAPSPPPDAAEVLKQLRIARLAVRDATVHWRDPERPADALVSGISVHGTVGTGRLELEAREITWVDERRLVLGPAAATIDVSPALDVTLQSMEVRAGASRLSAHGALASSLRLRPDLSFEGRLDLADGGRRLGLPSLSGGAALSGRVRGEGADLDLAVHLAGEAGWGEWRAEAVEIEAAHRLTTSRTELSVAGRALGGRIEGEARLDGVQTKGGVKARSLDLGSLPGGRPGTAQGSADVDLAWDGPIDGRLSVQARARTEARTAAGTLRVSAHAHGSLQPRDPAVDLEWTAEVSGTLDSRAAASEKRLETTLGGRIAVRGERLTASAAASGIDLARLAPGARGTAALTLDATGPLRGPQVSLRASVDDVGWQKARFGPLEARLEGDVRRSRLALDVPEMKVSGEGEVLGRRRLRGRLRLDDTPVEPVSPLLAAEGGAPFTGSLTAGVEYDVPLDRPSHGNATLDVARLEVEREGRVVRAEPFRATLREGRLLLEQLRITAPGVSLAARATGGLGPQDPLELQSEVAVDLPALPLPDGWSAVGTARAEVHVRGSRARPHVAGGVFAHDVALRAPSLPEIGVDEAELALEGDRVRIARLDARVAGGTARLSGVLPFASVFPALRSGPTGYDPAHLLLRWEGVSLDRVQGSVAGELAIEGGFATPREPRAVLSLPHTRVQVEGQPLEVLPTSLRLEDGRVAASEITLRTGQGDLVLTGGADLLGRTLDVHGRGRIELGTLSPLLGEGALGGLADAELAVSGALDAPHARGSVRVREGSMRLRAFPQALTGIEGVLELEGRRARVDVTGRMGGGSVELGGEAEVSGKGVHDVQLLFTGKGVALHYPPGLRSRLDADIVLLGRTGALMLDGDVAVERGLYEIDVAVEEALRAPVVAATESELLRAVGLDVRVRLPKAVLVRSALGELEVTGQLAARGDLQEPLPFGRLDVRPGGKLYLQGREFTVRSGAMTYSGTWDPELGLRADAVIPSGGFESREYRVTVSAAGSLEKPSLGFTSEPSLSLQEIVSLVATGRIEGRLADTGAWVLGGQAGTLLAGRLTRNVAQTFGLDEITIRPDLVARETDPSARFTFGKHLGRRAGLVYSVGLGGPETRFVQLEGRPGRDVTLKAQRTDSGTYGGGLGQRFQWGEATREVGIVEARVTLREVRFEGEAVEEELRGSVSLRPGSRVTEWRVQDEAERLRNRLRSRGHLEAEVAARLEDDAAVLTVRPGPVYDWRVDGVDDPPDLTPLVERALFAEEALDRGRDRLLEHLHEQGHLRAEVVGSTRGEGDRRTLVFSVRPGPRFQSWTVSFPGAQALSEAELRQAAGGTGRLLTQPDEAIAGIRDAYRRRHFLGTEVQVPRIEETVERLAIVVPIEEGPPARLAAVRFEGTSLAEDLLRSTAGLPAGEPFSDAAAEAAVLRVRELYFSRGYPGIRLRPQLVEEGHDLALVLHASEGERRAVEEIALSGNTRTRSSVVRRALDLRPGDPLDPRRVAQSEQRLLNLGVFSRAAVVPRPEKPSSLEVQLEEGPNLTAAYDVRWDDEAGTSALVEGEARNLLGTGLAIGARYQFGGDLRETRGSVFLPAVLGVGDLTGSAFRLEQDFTADEFEITRLQRGFQVQQQVRLPNRLEVLAGYRFRRNTTLAPGLPPDPIDVAGIDLSLLRNTRDDVLDPRQGRFLSVNLELAPRVVGSDAPFVKGYAQADVARSFADNSFTWAQSYRLGLAWGFEGEPVIPFERFYAGGAASLRGFGTNEVGPRGPLGDPAGGEAVVILNQELRYRHRSGLGAVVFYDLGNVFARARDLSFDLRHTLGAGLRWASPVGLLRVDLGFPFDREDGEKAYRLFFGLGQAF